MIASAGGGGDAMRVIADAVGAVVAVSAAVCRVVVVIVIASVLNCASQCRVVIPTAVAGVEVVVEGVVEWCVSPLFEVGRGH
jgi:hypothetical protein